MAIAESVAGQPTTYEVVLLAGSPRRYTLSLTAGIVEGEQIEVDGERWTVADVRETAGSGPQLICIYAD